MRRTIFLLLCIAMAAISFGQSPPSAAPSEQSVDAGKNGTLVVLVTWDDAERATMDESTVLDPSPEKLQPMILETGLDYAPPRLMLSKSRPHVSGTANRTNTSVTMQSVP
jgi:hypothetical protein